jgi:dTDP-4-amino-4,6-dideoxygalactose transaminase
MAALNLRKGSEVIVTPWTMSATVSCIVANDLVPVFADIDIDSFNLSPESVVERLTSETSAILAVDIFGKPCEAPRLKEIAEQNGLKLVIDAAQTPRAQIDGQRSSWYADIAGYSFNRHKHIQVGEGGIAVTDNDVFASRMKLIRNHAEVSGGPEPDAAIPVGFNWRLGEIEAELALFQIESFDSHIDHRVSSSKSLLEELKDIEHLILPKSALAMDHDFYILGMKLSPKVKVSRGKIISALRAEGVQNLIEGYQVLHRLPAFKSFVRQELKIADSLHDNHFLGLYMCGHSYKLENISEISKAFHKVFANLNVL